MTKQFPFFRMSFFAPRLLLILSRFNESKAAGCTCLVKEPSRVEEKQRKLDEGFWTQNRKGSALGATRLCGGDPKRNGESDGTRARGLRRDRAAL